jgi:hypothetical protein
MQAREPLATDGPIMIPTARIGIMRIVIVKDFDLYFANAADGGG